MGEGLTAQTGGERVERSGVSVETKPAGELIHNDHMDSSLQKLNLNTLLQGDRWREMEGGMRRENFPRELSQSCGPVVLFMSPPYIVEGSRTP